MEIDDMSILDQRKRLYNEVWKEPVVTIAKRYGISDTGIRKRCRKLNIPLPPAGYWAKFSAGKPVIKKTKLPPLRGNPSGNGGDGVEIKEDNKILKLIDADALSDEELKGLDSLDLLTSDSKIRFLKWCSKIKVPKRIANYDPLITSHQSEVAYRKARDDEHKFKDITFSMFSNSKIKYQNNKAAIPINVSDKEIGRVFRIIDTFIKAIRKLEGRIIVELREEDYAYIDFNGYNISFIIAELKVKRRSLLSNSQEENVKKSFRPSYEMIFGGELIMEFKEVHYYGERNKVPEVLLKFEDKCNCGLEDQLGEILIALCRLSNTVKIANIIKERENDVKRKEKEILYEIEEERVKIEHLVEGMEQQMESWYKSERLRKYADELESLVVTIADDNTKEILLAYISLVRRKAESNNPVANILNEAKAIGIERLI